MRRRRRGEEERDEEDEEEDRVSPSFFGRGRARRVSPSPAVSSCHILLLSPFFPLCYLLNENEGEEEDDGSNMGFAACVHPDVLLERLRWEIGGERRSGVQQFEAKLYRF